MNVTGTLRILVLISGIAFSSLRAGCQETLSVPGSGNGQGTEADERLRVALEQEPWTHRARTEIESAAKNGNPGAKLALAGLYSQGREVSRDPSRASALIREAAEAGLPSACYLIGAKFLDDDSAPPGTAIVGDYQSASEWLEKAASKGHVEAAHQLGELYYYGKLSYDFHLAAKWLRMAADGGDVKAAALLPYLYFCNHPGFARDRAEGLRWMRLVSRQPPSGWFDVRVQFARLVLADHPSAAEKSESLQWLRQAMDSGSVQALATLDALGEPVPAVDSAQLQALQDYCGMSPGTPACWRLGKTYEAGRDVPKDFAKALQYYGRCRLRINSDDPIDTLIACQAAEGIVRILASTEFVAPADLSASSLVPKDANVLTNPVSRLQLAQLLWTGSAAVPQNRTLAIEWFSNAAKAGSADAMLRLGELWQQGINGKPDVPEALRWYRKAATAGSLPAQLKLAQAYLNGDLGQTNRLEAYTWLRVADLHGSQEARRLAAEIEPQLTQPEIDNARQRADRLGSLPPR